MNNQTGKIVFWKNKKNERIVIMLTDKENVGVVIHSDNLLAVGTIVDASDYNAGPYVGSVTINSQSNNV